MKISISRVDRKPATWQRRIRQVIFMVLKRADRLNLVFGVELVGHRPGRSMDSMDPFWSQRRCRRTRRKTRTSREEWAESKKSFCSTKRLPTGNYHRPVEMTSRSLIGLRHQDKQHEG